MSPKTLPCPSSRPRKITPEAVVAQARLWLGVRWKHQGRSTVEGVDCAGLIICVARDFGESPWDLTNYSHAPGMANIVKGLETTCKRVPINQRRVGDILVMKVNTPEPWHLGIVTDVGLIHAYAYNRKVVEHQLDHEWLTRVSFVYRPKVYDD